MPRVIPTPDSKPVDERVTGYPFSPFVNEDGIVCEWEPSAPGTGWPGLWVHRGEHVVEPKGGE